MHRLPSYEVHSVKVISPLSFPIHWQSYLAPYSFRHHFVEQPDNTFPGSICEECCSFYALFFKNCFFKSLTSYSLFGSLLRDFTNSSFVIPGACASFEVWRHLVGKFISSCLRQFSGASALQTFKTSSFSSICSLTRVSSFLFNTVAELIWYPVEISVVDSTWSPSL